MLLFYIHRKILKCYNLLLPQLIWFTIGLRLIQFYLQLYAPRLPISITISTSVCITRVIIVARHCNFLYNHESFDTRHFSLSHIDNNISIGMGRGH